MIFYHQNKKNDQKWKIENLKNAQKLQKFSKKFKKIIKNIINLRKTIIVHNLGSSVAGHLYISIFNNPLLSFFDKS